MASSNAPVFPYPGGTAGQEPPDPQAGRPGHFAWSRWVKQFVKNLNTKTMNLEDRLVNVEAKIPPPGQDLGTALQRIVDLEAQVNYLLSENSNLKNLTNFQTTEINTLKGRTTNVENYAANVEARLTFHVNKPGHGGGT